MKRRIGFKRGDLSYDDTQLVPRLDPARHPEFESGRFESEGGSKDRRDTVVISLENGGQRAQRLARRLYLCQSTNWGAYCLSSACPICGRQFRRLHVSRILKAFGAKKLDRRKLRLLRSLTLIPYWAIRRAGELHTLDLAKASRMLRRQIQRAGLTDFVAAGAWDLSFNTEGPESEFWVPHLHLVVRLPSKARLAVYKKILKRILPKRRELGVKIPVKFEKLRDPLGQTSYTYKMRFCVRRADLPSTPYGSDYLRFDALSDCIKNELYLYLDKQKESGRSFLIGCARNGRQLVAT